MGLINLRTNLKDLKFGHDRYKWGSSKEPYIQTRIPATNEELQTSISVSAEGLTQGLGFALLGAGAGAIIGGGAGAAVGAGAGLAAALISGETKFSLSTPNAGTGGTDFLIRGGLLLPGRIINDEVRLGKFFIDTKGILFTVKQNLLSRLSVRTQASPRLVNEGLYTPLSTLLQAIGTPIGIHVNKQGLNPFGGGLGIRTYLDVVQDEVKPERTNRLIQLTKNNIAVYTDDVNVLSYGGGPGAPLGIGKTRISYATDNVGNPLKISSIPTIGFNLGSKADGNYAVLDYKQIEELSNETRISTTVVDFRKKLRNSLKDLPVNLFSNSPSYTTKNIENRLSLGDPGTSFKFLTSYTDGDGVSVVQSQDRVPQPGGGKGAASPSSYDKLNASGIFIPKSIGPTPFEHPDLINFKIEVFNIDDPSRNKIQIYFRAFLDNITDSYSSNWDPIKYIGRGENFYTYAGFDRKVSLSWTVAAQSKIELMQMYRRLNYLASVCAPNYSDSGYMRGNIITLTIGGYFYEQPGIISGFSYEMNDENDTWEIAIDDEGNEDTSVKQLPHIIRVKSFNFTPIHNFIPNIQNYSDTAFGNGIQIFGPERFIALNAPSGDNWNMEQYPTPLISSIESITPLGINPIPINPISAEPIKGIGFISGEDIVPSVSNIFV